MTVMPLISPCATRDHMPVANENHWRRDRLAEARSVLADVSHHPDTLIILAARVVARHTDDAAELADANELRRLLERRSLQTNMAVALPTGGAA